MIDVERQTHLIYPGFDFSYLHGTGGGKIKSSGLRGNSSFVYR